MILPIISKPFDSWNEEDLQRLCDERVPENQRLDYKRELKLEPPRERRELLKDITSLANSHGGVIIYGIEESKHADLGAIATSLFPLTDALLVDIANRVIRAHISPAVEYYLYTITAAAGGYYLLAHVPQSIMRPHGITWDKRLDYYIRRNQDNFPMTEPEVRQMYLQTSNIQQTLHQRYAKVNSDIGNVPRWKLLSMPLHSDMDLISTLTTRGRDLTTSRYVTMFGGSNILQPRVDCFEEHKRGNSVEILTRLHRSGEFLLTEGFLSSSYIIGAFELYKLWYSALRYFGEIYEKYGYYGPLRIWLETCDLYSSQIQLALEYGFNYRWAHDKDKVITWIDSKVEALDDPVEEANSLIRYFAQGCGTDFEESKLKEFEAKVRNYRV